MLLRPDPVAVAYCERQLQRKLKDSEKYGLEPIYIVKKKKMTKFFIEQVRLEALNIHWLGD